MMRDAVDVSSLQKILQGLRCFDGDGHFNDLGKEVLAYQLEHWMSGRLGPAFKAVRRAAGAPFVAVECVPVDPEKGVLLNYRDFRTNTDLDVAALGAGWHTSGTYPDTCVRGKEESMIQAVKRTAFEELGLVVEPLLKLATLDHIRNHPRFSDVGILFGCRIIGGEPKNLINHDSPISGVNRWFKECPPNMLPIHKDYVPHINVAVRTYRAWSQINPLED